MESPNADLVSANNVMKETKTLFDQAFVVPNRAIIQNDKCCLVQIRDRSQTGFHTVPAQTVYSLLNGIDVRKVLRLA